MVDLIAFFDVLGMTQMTKQQTIDPYHMLDLVNVVGAAASRNPEMRFAAFSDSVVISADEGLLDRFVSVLVFLLRNWTSDLVFVRGGLTIGEIDWIDQVSIDQAFRSLSNFHYSRVYGTGFVEAVEIEKGSGPGAICFLSEIAATRLAETSASYVVPGLVPMLGWIDAEHADFLNRIVGWNSCPLHSVIFRRLFHHALFFEIAPRR